MAGPKPYGIAKASGCGAYPNIFTDRFGPHPLKSDEQVVLVLIEMSSYICTGN